MYEPHKFCSSPVITIIMICSIFKVQMSPCLRKFVAVKIDGSVLIGQVQLTEYGDWLDVGEEVNLGGFLGFYI